MAKFSAAHYVILEKALVEAYKNAKDCPNKDYRTVSLLTVETAATFIALALAEDNKAFDQKHFMDVVKGLRPVPKRVR